MRKHRNRLGWLIGLALLTAPGAAMAQAKYCIACVWSSIGYPCTACDAGASSGYTTCTTSCSGYCLTTGSGCKVYASATSLGVYESRTIASLRDLDAVSARQTVWLSNDPAPVGRLASANGSSVAIQELVARGAIDRDCKSRIWQRSYSAEERDRIQRTTEFLSF